MLAFAACQSNAQTIINYNPSSGYHLTVDGENYVVKGSACEGNHLEAVHAIAYGWNGEYPENRVPEIHSIEFSFLC
mgnify:CR=1 FL=1